MDGYLSQSNGSGSARSARLKLLVVLLKPNQLVKMQFGQLNHSRVLERDMKLDINMVPP